MFCFREEKIVQITIRPFPILTYWQGNDSASSRISLFISAFSEEEQLALKQHNEYRRTHQVPLMTLDRAMSDQAKAYAGKLAAMGKLQHASSAERNGNGENLYFACTSGANLPSTGDAVKAW